MEGEQVKVEATPAEGTVAEPTQATPQTKTFTQDEVAGLILEQVQKARDEELQKYKGIQRTVSEKDKVIADLKKKVSEPPPTTPVGPLKTMLAALKENAEQNGIVNPRIAQVEVELAAIEREESTRKQQLQAEEYTNTWRSKLEQSITTAGLDPKDERFDDVWENFDLHYRLDGQFEFTEKKLARALKGVKVETKETKPPVDETKKLVETEITKRLAEAKREWMKQYGIVETEVAQPSAQSASDRKIRDNYIANPNDPNAKQAYMAYRARQGL